MKAIHMMSSLRKRHRIIVEDNLNIEQGITNIEFTLNLKLVPKFDIRYLFFLF